MEQSANHKTQAEKEQKPDEQIVGSKDKQFTPSGISTVVTIALALASILNQSTHTASSQIIMYIALGLLVVAALFWVRQDISNRKRKKEQQEATTNSNQWRIVQVLKRVPSLVWFFLIGTVNSIHSLWIEFSMPAPIQSSSILVIIIHCGVIIMLMFITFLDLAMSVVLLRIERLNNHFERLLDLSGESNKNTRAFVDTTAELMSKLADLTESHQQNEPTTKKKKKEKT